jgi:hypothetical protein
VENRLTIDDVFKLLPIILLEIGIDTNKRMLCGLFS